jgi:alpha-glucosidase
MGDWWREAVFYQIYPRSFCDSGADGIGDLRGIISKLDYLNDGKGGGLGVDALWISPFYPSPMRDFGYDISDYLGVDPEYGVMDDFRELVALAHRRGMKVILDMVLNHCSDEHPWFKAARASKENPKHGWFIWAPMRVRRNGGRKKPNNWVCLFTQKSAWHPNPATGEYFLGTFTPNQPEFDWRNPELEEAAYAVLRHWLDLGVDGFRFDVCTAYFKDDKLRSNPFSFRAVPEIFQKHVFDRNRPEVHQVFKTMRVLADSYPPPERVLIGEAHGHDPELAASCHGKSGEELHMAFNFDFLMQPWSAERFKRSAIAWYAALPEGAWPNFTLSNHDQLRAARRYRPRIPGKRGRQDTDARCRILCAMLLCLRGTPFIYYGEEIGMRGGHLKRSELRDPAGLSTWPLPFGRDPERRPMQWDGSPNSGFSPAKPWLPLDADYRERNVEAQLKDPASLLSFYSRLIRLRKSNTALLSGEIRFLPAPRGVLAFQRTTKDGSERVVVLLNFSRRLKTFRMQDTGSALFGTSRKPGDTLAPGDCLLFPYEILIVKRVV